MVVRKVRVLVLASKLQPETLGHPLLQSFKTSIICTYVTGMYNIWANDSEQTAGWSQHMMV